MNAINVNDEYENEVPYDTSLDKYATYEDYLDDHITKTDLFYLEDRDLARQLVELGHHARGGELLSRETFEEKKAAAEEAKKKGNKEKTKALAHTEVPPEKYRGDPFLEALEKRESDILNGRLMSIIFVRAKPKNNEISGYIDLEHRLKTEDFRPYFEGKKKLYPKTTDLSYYNWNTGVCVSNDSPNFKVDANSGMQGLLFRNKRDRKVINVDPNKKQDDVMTREEIDLKSGKYATMQDGKSTTQDGKSTTQDGKSTTQDGKSKDDKDSKSAAVQDYIQIVFYDHRTRRKN